MVIFVIHHSQLTIHETYMHRCIELAKLGAGYVAPNPMVGAILVHEDRIIGEGYHQHYGRPHAEVNCIDSVKEEDRHLITSSNLYVSLEPCSHFGKTPPCSDLIIKNKIKKVVIGCRDPFKKVDGKGIEKLKAAGIEVELGVLEEECKELNKRFMIFTIQHRPYIILKWAQTADGKIANDNSERLFISNDITNRVVHKWRSEEASILVGTNTALSDDPELTTRNWYGPSPVRLVVDIDLKLPQSLKLFDQKQLTIVFNEIKQEEQDKLIYYQVTEDVNLIHQIVNALHQLKIQSVLVEGGAKLLQSFIDTDYWDEARVIKNEKLMIGNGLNAPVLIDAVKISEQHILSDHIEIHRHQA
jgi:diaminohydroxyphosphoribosylaminopyrimidine deaminase/5-amino-6-(5-phosphoribosylamino)uracil reductase